LSFLNGAVLAVISNCGYFHVVGLVPVALAWTIPTIGVPV